MRTPYQLPEKDCERLKRSEMQAVRMCLAVVSVAAYAKDDLKDRLDCVPDGNRRMRLAVGLLKAVVDDLIGTVSAQQARQLYGTMKDYNMCLLPKLTPFSEVANATTSLSRLSIRACGIASPGAITVGNIASRAKTSFLTSSAFKAGVRSAALAMSSQIISCAVAAWL